MKFCPNCGAKLPEGVKFCPECGYSIATPQASVNTTVTQTQPMPVEIKKVKFNWKVFIIMMLVGLLIIGVGAAVIVSMMSNSPFGVSNSQRKDEERDDDEDEDRDDDDDDDEDEDDDDVPLVDATMAPQESQTFYYKDFHIELSGSYFKNSDGCYVSDEEQTVVHAGYWEKEYILDAMGLDEDDWDAKTVAKAIYEMQDTDVDIQKNHDGVPYFYEEYEYDDGYNQVEMVVFYITEDYFWEITFTYHGEELGYDDLKYTWNDYLDTVWFD